MAKETPILKQYKEIKSRYPDEILLFRIGDFYETFLEDAKITSKVLGIVLTSKPVGKGIRVPLAGIPVKAAESYISKLLKAGYRVAICEQIGEPGKGIMRREVVEVITPGTVFSPSLLEDKKFNYIASLIPDDSGRAGAAVAELTTGDFFLMEDAFERVIDELKKLGIAELLIPEGVELEDRWITTELDPIEYSPTDAEMEVKRFLGVSTLEGFGVKDMNLAVRAARALISYLRAKKPGMIEHIRGMRVHRLENFMFLDTRTVKNLELIETIHPDEGMPFVDVLDRTKTPMGARRLREAVLSPFLELKPILERQSRVAAFFDDPSLSAKVGTILRNIADIERLASRLSARKGGPRELFKLGQSLQKLPELRQALQGIDFLSELVEQLPDLSDLAEEITSTIVDNPPPTANEGGVIRDGVDPALDELRDLAQHGKEKLMELEAREKTKTGIPTLRIGYNNVFGYYIEVSRAYANRVPPHYVRKQTLKNAERYITDELKQLEDRILGAEERMIRLEKEHIERLRQRVFERADDIKKAAEIVAELDLDLSLAEVARNNRYVRPTVEESGIIDVVDGRHPVVEVMSTEPFIPNDIHMDDDENRVFIITGPNMSGKSTYLRQTALIVIMAQMGSFVPAKSARIGLVDRIFTRIGASDDLARGVSTFMAEMVETAEILHNATPRSLIILDEVGRGTSTYDGMAIAWAVVEYIAEKLKSKALFATHYHELAELGRKLHGVKNMTVAVKEWKDEIIFLRKVVPGETDRSYGVFVARLAGLPQEVIKRANEVLKQMESRGGSIRAVRRGRVSGEQLMLFRPPDPLREKLKRIDPDSMTPREALEFLYKLKEELDK